MASNLRVSDKTTLHGQVVLSESSGGFSDLALDDSRVPKIPPGFNYTDITELQDYSNLQIRWWYLEGGFKQLFTQNFVFEYYITYNDYDDKQPYIVDTTGSKFGMLARLNLIF